MVEQKVFITMSYKANSAINGAEVRKLFSSQYPLQTPMFGKKVQNLLQILRQGKEIIKDPEGLAKLERVQQGEPLFTEQREEESEATISLKSEE